MFERNNTYGTFDDLEAALRAADTLGFGFRVRNYWHLERSHGPDHQEHDMYYVLELFDDAPEGDDT